MATEKHDIAAEIVKAAPAAAGAVYASFTLSEWVAVVTIVYIVVQVAYLIRKWIREETEWGRKIAGKE